MSDTGRAPPQTPDDDEALARAVEAASSVALQRFRALMESRDATGHPVNALVDGLQAPRHAPGDLVRQYRIVRELGSGGMGSVFLAERADGQFRRQVALKVLRGFPTEEGRRRLRSERQVLAELDHPGIAKLLDGGETADGQPFLVLEYVEGETLHAAVARQQLDLRARVTLVERIAEAVAHAHQRLVVHRDLKPNNVMVTRDGTPRLLDFGVARLLTEIGDEQSTRVYTPGYASPEQIAGGRITTRSDVYALGVLLHELVTGTRLDGRPLEPPLPPARYDLDLRGIARKASSEEPEERYPSADAFLDDLRRWRAGLPVLARPDTALYRMGRFVRRHRKAVAVAALVIAVTAGLLVRLQRENRRAQRAEAASSLEKVHAEREAARAHRLLEFVNQIFEAAAPDNAQGKPLSASELVVDARHRLDLEVVAVEDRPEVLAMLAEIAGRIGDSKQSLELSSAALQALPPATDRNTARRSARILELHSRLLSGAGQLKEGVEAARTAEALVQRYAPDDAQAVDEAALHVGFALSANLDPAARPTLERFAEGRSSLTEPTVPLQASRSLLALSAHLKDGPRAIEDARRSRRLVESLPPGHPHRTDALYQEAVALQELGRFQEALPLMKQAIAEQEKAFGPKGNKTADMYGALATLLDAMSSYREAAEANDHSLQLLRDAGETGSTLLVGETNAAALVETSGDYPRAEAILRSVLARSASLPQGYRDQIESNLARVLALRGKHDEARAILQRLRAAARADNRQDLGLLGFRLAQNALWAERGKEARAEIDAVAGEFVADQPQRRWQYQRTEALIRALEGEKVDALERLRRLEGEAGLLFGADSFEMAYLRAGLAEVLVDLGRTDEARSSLTAALSFLRRAVLPQERNRARAEALGKKLGIP